MRHHARHAALLALLLAVICAMTSCHSREKIVYIQGAERVGTFDNQSSYEARIAPDNRLTILVTCSDLDLAVPFNLQRPQASVEHGGGSYSTNYQDNENLYYYVDKQGCINFPTFGVIHVEGMTRGELSAYLSNLLVTNGYITDPIVNVAFYGAHYSVIGEVNAPGTFSMVRDRVTIFEAIASAGDLTIFGERDKVRLIRRDGDKEHVVGIDLKDPSIVGGPYYYMHDGDVLYVEPSGTRAANREISNLSNFAISVTSILITVASLIITVTKL